MVKVLGKTLCIAGMGIILFSCVPARQYQQLQSRQQNCQKELDEVKEKYRNLNEQNTEMESRLGLLEDQAAQLRSDTVDLGRRLRISQQQLKRSEELNNELMSRQRSLNNGNSKEIRDLLAQVQNAQDDLRIREDEVLRLEKQMNVRKHKLDALKEQLEQRNSRLAQMQRILDQKDKAVRDLKRKVTDALTGFENKGLSIDTRNGKVYVSMQEKLLFKSGRYDVDPQGQNALKKLAVVLAQNSDINVMIEGHTDNVPFRGKGVLKDNWDLSVKRATSIVRIIIQNKKIDPKRLTVAGRSKYLPIDASNTAQARKKNRRTEIILTPKLDELFKILNSN